jgi:hypothetical protein
MTERVYVTGKYREAALRKPQWCIEHAKRAGISRQWQFLDEPHAIGDWGEAALCQFLGVDPDREMFKADPRLPDVCGIEVKTTIYRHGHLLVMQQVATAEHVLAYLDADREYVDLLGWITPAKINDDVRFPMQTRGKAPPTRWIPASALNEDIGALCFLVYERKDGILI